MDAALIRTVRLSRQACGLRVHTNCITIPVSELISIQSSPLNTLYTLGDTGPNVIKVQEVNALQIH